MAFCGVLVTSAGVALSAFARTPADIIVSAGLIVGESENMLVKGVGVILL